MLKFVLPPTPTPDASQWNIGGVGSSGIGAGVGHVHFMLFMSISFASGTQRKPVFWWNMGLMIIKVGTIFNQSGQFGHAVHVLKFRPSTFAKGLSKQRSCVNADR